MHESIELDEKIGVVDKYCQQLVNSGYSQKQIREIVVSSLKGTYKKEKRKLKDMTFLEFLYEVGLRLKKKLQKNAT